MVKTPRQKRLNSLLREVISDVVHRQVKNPRISPLTTITKVIVTQDLQQAKVYISIIGDEKTQKETLNALRSASGFISTRASKEVVTRFFPTLTFLYDDTVEKQMRIDHLLKTLEK